jgi:hypothetical protein
MAVKSVHKCRGVSNEAGAFLNIEDGNARFGRHSARHDLSFLRFDEQIFTLDLHEPRTHGPLRWTTKDSARGHIELAAVAWARHSRAIKLALRERAPLMGARVIEGIQMSECTCDVHLDSRDVEDAHLVRDYILCVTHSCQHDFTSSRDAIARSANLPIEAYLAALISI